MSGAAGTAAEVLRPRSLAEALHLLAEAARTGTELVPLAGGTDIFVGLHFGTLTGTGGREPERRFLDLWGLAELRHITAADDGALRLGALTTYTDCIRSPLVGRRLPILAAASKEVGGVQIQNRGTIGGNIANASPAGDAIPVLMAAEAEVVLASVAGERAVPLADYYTGYRASVRRPDELIVAVRTPVPAGRQVFRKVGTRAAQAISKVVLAAVGHRIALGSVAPVVMRARKVEAYLVAGGRDLAEAQRLLLEEIRPIDDVRSTAAYRRRVAANLLADVLRSL
jgi:xanthine dehydrogenase small subunit